MFRLTYREPHDRDHSEVEYFDDIKDLGQALINIVDNEKEENSAMEWCGRAHWGDKVVRQQFGYKIECFNEEKLKADIQAVANEISKHCGVANSFVGWDNDSLTWDFNVDLTYMKFHDNYGYYMTINLYDINGTPKNVWEFTSKQKEQFIKECIKALTKYGNNNAKNISTNKTLTAKEVVNAIKKAEADGKEWHGRVYEDNCWWADIERHPYGQIRFWVGFEDKRSGKSRASIVTLAYLNNNGDLRYCTDGIQIKQVVWNKIQSTAKALIKAGILKL